MRSVIIFTLLNSVVGSSTQNIKSDNQSNPWVLDSSPCVSGIWSLAYLGSEFKMSAAPSGLRMEHIFKLSSQKCIVSIFMLRELDS